MTFPKLGLNWPRIRLIAELAGAVVIGLLVGHVL
jgi:hypothetical protein